MDIFLIILGWIVGTAAGTLIGIFGMKTYLDRRGL